MTEASGAEHDSPSFYGRTTRRERRTGLEPSGIFPQPMSISSVTFRSLAETVSATDDGPFVQDQRREVAFVNETEQELPANSKISFSTAQDSTLPMAFDNQRFFGSEDGYGDLLREASRAITSLARSGKAWGEPTMEMGIAGWLWRCFVIFFMWLTNDELNRLRFTRGIQDSLPFQMGYESFVIGRVVQAFDEDKRQHDINNLTRCFKNRNASRVLVQNLSRWDWLWHLGPQITWSRTVDFIGRFPLIGFTAFPATENFPSSAKNHALRGFFRTIFEGSWFTRFITSRQQSAVTFDRHAAAQNLAPETTRLEQSNRDQYGTFIGRDKTNEFRSEHRLTTDESIVRTFMTSPGSTMINNGVEHVLRCLAKHWRNMLYQENGNFAHQRMEQLNPFETLRFHMPVVLTVLANLRGRNQWDIKTLGPFITDLPFRLLRYNQGDIETANQGLSEIHDPCQAAQQIVREIKEEILSNVCGGVPSRMEPFERWLDAISEAIDELGREARVVKEFLASVNIGIKLGYKLLYLVDWSVPAEEHMTRAIIDFLDTETLDTDLPREVVESALKKLPPKDERTLRELVKQDLCSMEAAKLLISRTCTLLERELRRKALDDRIHELSKGPKTSVSKLETNKWYWVDTEDGSGSRAFVFKRASVSRVKLVDVETRKEEVLEIGPWLKIWQYIPFAEAISRAQKAFMTIEVDYGKKFAYNAFMEFGSPDSELSLRVQLRRLATLAQVHCSALDQARLNLLAEVKSRRSPNFAASRLVPECRPQNVIVLGGGPTGLLGAIHCLHNVILSGGEVKVYEKREAFERAQIVRLDARQIAMVRYHLGTGFEDVYIPAKGETDAHHGNTLPSQGFVEVTIKRLEDMIHFEIIKLCSKELLHYCAGSTIEYDVVTGTFKKKGQSLQVGDRIFNQEQDPQRIMEVLGFVYNSRVTVNELAQGQDYDIVLPRETQARPYRLVQMDRHFDWYQFSAHQPGVRDVVGSFLALPPVYSSGNGQVDPTGIVVNVNGSVIELPFDAVKDEDENVRLDYSASHVIVACGKPKDSPSHLCVTTHEPYAVCCMEGIKISMGMHMFGRKRWGSGLIDDIRSHSDQNTRIVGDFTKSIALVPIVERMKRKLAEDPVWKSHLEQLPESLNDRVRTSLHMLILHEIVALCGTTFRRERLQTRFFELGNNYYLGMELPREYDHWKNVTISKVAPSRPETAPEAARTTRSAFQDALANHIDRLWYESTLEIIAEGDVYNPGGKGKIPQLYTIDSPFEQRLGELKGQEAFRLFRHRYRVHSHDGNGFTQIRRDNEQMTFSIPSNTDVLELPTRVELLLGQLDPHDVFEPIDTFEVIAKRPGLTIVRNSGGFVAVMPNDVRVGRASDLARGPNGYSESSVALASFPVAHVVSHRTLRVNRVQGGDGEDGFITAYVGDAQASPHFMRYSGLTGACINCMSFNNLVGHALLGVPFEERIQRYSFETNWSNGEVVQRGTGSNYGEDGFLRPGFSHRELVDYLYERVLEHDEIGADTAAVLSRDWKIKLASAIVPRGLENDVLFKESLQDQLLQSVHSKFEDEVKLALGQSELPPTLARAIRRATRRATRNEVDDLVRREAGLHDWQGRVVTETGSLIRDVLNALKQTIDYSVELRQGNLRISSELVNQPKPVDAIVDDFVVEAQNFANALTESAAYSAATIALSLYNNTSANIASAVLGVLNIIISFSTMTSAARYRNRNEESRRKFFDEKLPTVMKSVFSLMTPGQRDRFANELNPFMEGLNHLVTVFVAKAQYYNVAEVKIRSFENAYGRFKVLGRDRASTLRFTRQLVQEFIPGTFHENSYLQEDLVNIYKALYEILSLESQVPANGMAGADELYRMLLTFRSDLTASIERGDVKYGFLRDHSWNQTPLPVTLRYIFGPLLGKRTMAGKTLAILKAAWVMRTTRATKRKLSRPVRDLTELYHATKESEVASMIVLSVFIVFWFSVFFSIVRLIEFAGRSPWWIRPVRDAAVWASIGSLLGSTLAVLHFIRKLKHLFRLDATLGIMRSDPRIQLIRSVARTQEFLVALRLLAVIAASIALPWSIAEMTWGDNISLSDSYPGYLAAVSVVAALSAVIFFFFVEFGVRYNLDPCLGRAVCEPFRARIEHIKNTFTTTDSIRIETTQKLEAEAWEYTARQFLHEYRFDTVFGADRFGTILQHLQSGNKLHDE